MITIIEISLIIVGLAMLIISFLIKDNKVEENETRISGFSDKNLLTDTNVDKLFSQIEGKLKMKLGELVEESLGKTEEHLNRISNEKIMAVTELSDQVLDKINKNHTEVVFLYDMLTDKEKEVRLCADRTEGVRRKLEDTIASIRELKIDTKQKVPTEQRKKQPENRQLDQLKTMTDKTRKRIPVQEKDSEKVLNEEVSNSKNQIAATKQEDTVSRSAQILTLFREGKSILEISKQLNIGQGEVKLVVDLFQNVRKQG